MQSKTGVFSESVAKLKEGHVKLDSSAAQEPSALTGAIEGAIKVVNEAESKE